MIKQTMWGIKEVQMVIFIGEVFPLGLTAQGHEFLAQLKEPEVWSKIKEQFKEFGIDAVKIAAKELTTILIKKKIKDVFGSENS